MDQIRSKVGLLNFRKAKFQLLGELVGGILRETALRNEGVEESWQISKEVFYWTQELEIPSSKNSGKRSAWQSRDRLVRLKGKKQMHRQWKLRQVIWEEHRDKVWFCRAGVRKAQAQLKLNLAKDKVKERASPGVPTRKRRLKKVLPPIPTNKSWWKTGCYRYEGWGTQLNTSDRIICKRQF